MKMWKIGFHKKAKEEFYDLPKPFKEDFVALFKKIRAGGFDNVPKKYLKSIGDGIFELRVRNQQGIARSLYVLKAAQTLKLLVFFVKKTQKTPIEKIDLAKRRKDD